MSFSAFTPSIFFTKLFGFESKPFGLAFSEDSMTAVQLKGNAKNGHIRGYATANLGKNTFKNGLIVNKKHTAQTLMALVKNAKPSQINNENIILSVPDNQCYFRLFTEPQNDINTLIESNFPVPIQQLYYHAKTVTINKKPATHIVAVEKDVLDNYTHAVGSFAGLKPFMAEPAITSLLRNIEIEINGEEGTLICYQNRDELTVVFLIGALPIDSFSIPFPKTREAALKMVQSELNKTTKYLQEEHDVKFKNIYLLGGKTDFTPLQETLQDEIKLNTKFIQSFRVVPENEPNKGIAQWCMAAGGALRGIGLPVHTPVNLLKLG
jgi:Tfp pilus assembly PilM family ATPase